MINIGVIGCGYWGPNLIRNFNSLAESRVKKICDVDSGRLSHIQQLYRGVETTTDFNDIINDKEITAVVIALPVHLHFKMAMQSLQAGKHTFIEKPMASSAEECRQLIAVAEKNKLTLMVGHTFIYCAAVRKIKSIIDSGELGELLYICSRRLNMGLYQKDINVAWDLAPHDISIILYLLNEMPLAVNCQGQSHISQYREDVTNMTVYLSNNKVAIIHSSWLDPVKTRHMTFVGTKKMLVYDDLEPIETIKIYDKRVEKPPHYDTFAEFHYAYHHGDMYSPRIESTEPLKQECGHFISCIKTGAKPYSSGTEGLKVVEVLEAADKSLKAEGMRVKI
ncbi:MAG: Gfo/Idh/MocA family oxidoreductase [Planctomycetaceae bacterium]|nr:Gfo/Idh/MocA family oxidoreductase [Planctomycetaceae bacterium]